MSAKVKLHYDHFKLRTSDVSAFGGKCPLCQTVLEANVWHECSNGVLLERTKESAVKGKRVRS